MGPCPGLRTPPLDQRWPRRLALFRSCNRLSYFPVSHAPASRVPERCSSHSVETPIAPHIALVSFQIPGHSKHSTVQLESGKPKIELACLIPESHSLLVRFSFCLHTRAPLCPHGDTPLPPPFAPNPTCYTMILGETADLAVAMFQTSPLPPVCPDHPVHKYFIPTCKNTHTHIHTHLQYHLRPRIQTSCTPLSAKHKSHRDQFVDTTTRILVNFIVSVSTTNHNKKERSPFSSLRPLTQGPSSSHTAELLSGISNDTRPVPCSTPSSARPQFRGNVFDPLSIPQGVRPARFRFLRLHFETSSCELEFLDRLVPRLSLNPTHSAFAYRLADASHSAPLLSLRLPAVLWSSSPIFVHHARFGTASVGGVEPIRLPRSQSSPYIPCARQSSA